jgi:hypothetical protein
LRFDQAFDLAGPPSSLLKADSTFSRGIGSLKPGGFRKLGRSGTAARSDAHDAKMARFTSGSSWGWSATRLGSILRNIRDIFSSFLAALMK